VEHALQLFANEMIEEHKDVKGKKKLVIQKLHNPNTGICSGSLTEFPQQHGTKQHSIIWSLSKNLIRSS